MSIKVQPWLYRTLWIAVAVIGALCTLGLIPLLFDDEGFRVISGRPTLIVMVIVGAIILVYALWRLLRPLRAPPQN